MSSEIHVPAVGLQRFIILLCVSIPSFMINLDSNIVAVSLSSIAHSFNADFADIEWVISAYTLTFASLVLPAGSLADRYGRKRILVIGLAIFSLASLICGAAPNVATLNAARALQGVGAALLLSGALATLSHSFRGADRARAFAFWGSVIGIAISLGLAIIGVGLIWLGVEATRFDYVSMIAGLLLAGIGAGVLNGETAKVAMSAIPPERAGMSGTVRFSGIVIGFAALGAILFHRVAASIASGAPAGVDPLALTHNITAGDLSGGAQGLASLALNSFGSGYQAILFVAAGMALVSSVLSWFLVRSADTAPSVYHRPAAVVSSSVK